MNGIAAVAAWQTRRLQSGVQRHYLLIVFATLGLSLAVTLWIKNVVPRPALGEATFLDWSLAALVAAASVVIIRSRSRLLGICALGVVGVATALIFLTFGAPDVAMTQLIVETLVTVIAAIVLLKLPDFRNEIWPSKLARLRNGIVAVTVGVSVTLVLLAVTASPPQPDLRDYFERTAVPGGQGRNIVNVILVDFRALDTLGEITVLAIAGAAVFALLLPGGGRRREGVPQPDTGGAAARAQAWRGSIMNTMILRETTRWLVPLILVVSVFLLLRGHEHPGGGFVGGLVASIAFSLHAFVFGPQAARGILRADPRAVGAVGLTVAIASGFIGSIRDAAPFLTGQWGTLAGLKFGTPVMFDVGVYLVVIGVVLTFVIGIKER